MIFVLIAGTYTPFSLLVLHGAWRWVVLGLVWVGAAIGITLKMVPDRRSEGRRRRRCTSGSDGSS